MNTDVIAMLCTSSPVAWLWYSNWPEIGPFCCVLFYVKAKGGCTCEGVLRKCVITCLLSLRPCILSEPLIVFESAVLNSLAVHSQRNWTVLPYPLHF